MSRQGTLIAALWLLVAPAGLFAQGTPGTPPASAPSATPAAETPVDPAVKEKELKARLKKNSKDAEAAYELGNLYYDDGRREEAEAQYRAALSAKPDYMQARINLGVVLNESGRSEDAIKELDRVLEATQAEFANPDKRELYVSALCNKGQALYALQKYSEAVSFYQKAIGIDPKSQLGHYLLGIAFADAGIYREAIRDWQRVVDIDPNSDAAKTASEGIKVLQDMLKEGQ